MSVQVELVPNSMAADSDVIILGALKLSPETSWVSTDAKIANIFKVQQIDYLYYCAFISVLVSIILQLHHS